MKQSDYVKLNDKEVPYVKQIVDYLESNNLEVKLAGSATFGNKQHNDVDLAVTGSKEDMMKAYYGLLGRRSEDNLSKRAAEGFLEWQARTTPQGDYVNNSDVVRVLLDAIYPGINLRSDIKLDVSFIFPGLPKHQIVDAEVLSVRDYTAPDAQKADLVKKLDGVIADASEIISLARSRDSSTSYQTLGVKPGDFDK